MKLFSHATMIAVTNKLHDSFTVLLEAKISSMALLTAFYYRNIDRKILSGHRCHQQLATEILLEPKRSSFSRKMEVAKLFLCSKLSIKSC